MSFRCIQQGEKRSKIKLLESGLGTGDKKAKAKYAVDDQKNFYKKKIRRFARVCLPLRLALQRVPENSLTPNLLGSYLWRQGHTIIVRVSCFS